MLHAVFCYKEVALYAAKAAQFPEIRFLAVAHQHIIRFQWKIVFCGIDNY